MYEKYLFGTENIFPNLYTFKSYIATHQGPLGVIIWHTKSDANYTLGMFWRGVSFC